MNKSNDKREQEFYENDKIRCQNKSGASSHAKHGGAYFSAVRGSSKDPIAVPGRDEATGV